jgi:hypothetical protein
MAESGSGGEDTGHERWPIGFIVLVVAAAAYLLLRFIQVGAWLLQRITGN